MLKRTVPSTSAICHSSAFEWRRCVGICAGSVISELKAYREKVVQRRKTSRESWERWFDVNSVASCLVGGGAVPDSQTLLRWGTCAFRTKILMSVCPVLFVRVSIQENKKRSLDLPDPKWWKGSFLLPAPPPLIHLLKPLLRRTLLSRDWKEAAVIGALLLYFRGLSKAF